MSNNMKKWWVIHDGYSRNNYSHFGRQRRVFTLDVCCELWTMGHKPIIAMMVMHHPR
jgi:hypothetical protein